jgi:quinone-modifying oxidoreductase subunit QmoA
MIACSKKIVVVGGGMSGITTALEAAETGYEVYLIERDPYLGGRVARMEQYFPKMCPPYCGLEINFKRIRQNPSIKVFTTAEVEQVSGSPGAYEITVKQRARYVNDACTACGKCVDACPVERPNDFNYGMDKTKAIYMSHEMAYPQQYVIDESVCKGAACAKCVEACAYKAINLEDKTRPIKIEAGSIVVTTGWKPYDAIKLDNLSYGKYPNIITNVMMERLAAINGPTGGKLLRPGDNKEVKKVAFVQCAGSRDENHLPYCSTVCCLASMKQSVYIRSRIPDSEVTIFYIDLRARGRYESVLQKIQADDKTKFQKGKVAKIEQDDVTGDLLVTAEDTLTGNKSAQQFDMVVLATGMQPEGLPAGAIPDLKYDAYNFALQDLKAGGVFTAGCAKRPSDVAGCTQDATGAALRAIQTIVKGDPR